MGPTCEVVLESDDGATLDTIDLLLASIAEQVTRTRKGRTWDVWVRGRPIHVHVTGMPPRVELSAGCNGPEDYTALRELTAAIALTTGGIVSVPEN